MSVMENRQVIHDKFCWRCCGEDTSLKCSNCIRSFHQNCAPNAAKDDSKSNSWLCSVCVNLKEAENTSKKLELDMLPLLIEKALKNKTFNLLKHPLGRDSYPESYITESIVHPVDLSKIKQKIGTYTSFDHFLSDIQWIVHNCFILFLDNHHRMEIAKSLVDYMEEEIEIVKKCPECYNNAVKYPNDWFTVICSDPHIIVWAKKMGFNYWPAKLMSIDGQLINVRFFGDHKNMDVMSTNCFLYSETNPNRSRNTTVLYKSALKEVEVYIKNCRSKFGAYNHVDTKIPFNPALLDKYIVQVIPALANSKMVKGIKARIKASESSTLKTTSRPSSEDRVDRTDAAVKLNLKEISPKKNVLIALHRIDDKMPNAKRNGKEAMLGTPDGPCEKKAKVSQDPENIESKHTPMATSQSQTQSVQKQTNSNENSERNQSQSVENQPENTIVSSVETTLVEDPEKPLLNSTVIKWPENVKSDGDFGDVSCINGQSIEEPTSTATLEDTEWEQSFEKDLNDTVQAATYHMYSSIAKNLKTKFDVLKEKLHDVTIERDQIVLKAERTKQRTKDDHAKEMSDLNEKYTQVIAKAKKDAEHFWKAEIEKEKTKGENSLNEVLRVMTEKLNEANTNLNNSKAMCEKERQTMVELKKQHSIEMETAIKNLKNEHKEEIKKIDAKLQDAITEKKTMETQLAAKYRDIVAGIKQKADTERKERISCACCGKQLEAKRVCSKECEEMWGVWRN